MDYTVTIDAFEGPLDLLLHLIKESKMDLFHISLEEVTSQYLSYIHHMETLNLNIASEYLVMAAELLEWKSRKLLPRHHTDSEEEEEDPKQILVDRLVEYQRYKEVSKNFHTLEGIRQEIYTKLPENMTQYASLDQAVNHDVGLDDLLLAFSNFLKRQQENKPLKTKVATKEITVAERRKEISSILHTKKRVNFLELFEQLTKPYIVVTFLTILEMAKEREIKIEQDHNFSSIFCEVIA